MSIIGSRCGPQRGVLYLQWDYKQNDTIPVGPAEGGDWYWATSREQITTLGFYAVWLDPDDGIKRERYYHFCSSVLEHSALFAVTCLKDVLQDLEISTFTGLSCWVDCGPHFRCYEMAAFLLVEVLLGNPLLLFVTLNFFCEAWERKV